jgi:hypothetical protein
MVLTQRSSFLRRRESTTHVIPAKAGIQFFLGFDLERRAFTRLRRASHFLALPKK